jgi:hypothetical protein
MENIGRNKNSVFDNEKEKKTENEKTKETEQKIVNGKQKVSHQTANVELNYQVVVSQIQ